MKCEGVSENGRWEIGPKNMLRGWHQNEVGDVRWTLTNGGRWDIGPTHRWEMGG